MSATTPVHAQLAAGAMAAMDFGASVSSKPKGRGQRMDEEREALEKRLRRMFPRVALHTELRDYGCAVAVTWYAHTLKEINDGIMFDSGALMGRRWGARGPTLFASSTESTFSVARRILNTAYPYPRYQP